MLLLFQRHLLLSSRRCTLIKAASSIRNSTGCFPQSRCLSTTKLPRDFYPLNERPDCNVTENIASRVGMNLHLQPNHPLNRIHNRIADHFSSMQVFNDLSPIVSTKQNFDVLRIPPDHVSRAMSDTYYLNTDTVLRTHTSAHQVDLLKAGHTAFLVTGDVYRRDEIDSSHYPVFHQTEGVKMLPDKSLQEIETDLKQQLEGLARHLFGQDVPMRWVDEYFPFTDPSFELEIYYNDDWMEVLGCGVIHPDIITHAGLNPENEKGWAFGLGLERLAMVLYQIPDIRLFWSMDERFHQQFADPNQHDIVFQPYSKYPPCYKDISFWLNLDDPSKFHVNDLNEIVRDVAGDLVEQVELIDDFVHPKTQRTSHCYRISYRSMDRSLTNAEIDDLQQQVRDLAVDKLGVELR